MQNPYGSFNGAWFSGGGVTQPSGGSSSNPFSPATPSNANLPWLKSAGGQANAQPGLITGMSTDITDRFAKMRDLQTQLGNQQGTGFGYGSAIEGNAWMPGGPVTASSRGLGGEGMSLAQKQQILDERNKWQPPNSTGYKASTGNAQPPQYPSTQTTQMQPSAQKAQAPAAQSSYGYGAAPQAFQSYLANPMADVNAARSTMAAGPYGQLMANPQSFTPQVIQDLLRTGETDINQQAMGQKRQMLEAAAPGTAGGGVMGRQMFDLESGRQNAMTQLGRDVRTQAALQNFQDLMNASNLQAGTEQSLAGLGLQGRQGAANLQFGAEQALADLMLRENTLRQQMYNTDFSNMGRMVDSTAQFGAADQTRRMQLWQQLQGLMNQGISLPDYYLDRAMQREAARLMPSAVSQMPATAFGAGGGSGGYSGGSGGNGFADAMPDLMAAMGMWASNRWGGN